MYNTIKRYVFIAGILAGLLPGVMRADFSLVLTSATTDLIELELTGTFDTDTTETFHSGLMGIKNDWLNYPDTYTTFTTGSPTVTDTILIDGKETSVLFQDTNSWAQGQTIHIVNPDGIDVAFTAGSVVTGTITLSGVGIFDPTNLSQLDLVSGLGGSLLSSTSEWVDYLTRIESAVPEPATYALLLGLGSLVMVGFVKRVRFSKQIA